MEDFLLIEQSSRGSAQAFQILVLRYQRMVFSFLRRYLLSDQVLEDLAQETFLRAFVNIGSFDAQKGASFSTWLITIARNLALNEKVKRKRGNKNMGRLAALHQKGNHENTQDRMEKRHRESHLRHALNQLPNKFYSAVILSYFHDLSLGEVADIEKCSVGTVKSRIFRGKRMLRRMLEKENIL
jgi:RNA polymerase sigma-70 factor (ECF subfamily)